MIGRVFRNGKMNLESLELFLKLLDLSGNMYCLYM